MNQYTEEVIGGYIPSGTRVRDIATGREGYLWRGRFTGTVSVEWDGALGVEIPCEEWDLEEVA